MHCLQCLVRVVALVAAAVFAALESRLGELESTSAETIHRAGELCGTVAVCTAARLGGGSAGWLAESAGWVADSAG